MEVIEVKDDDISPTFYDAPAHLQLAQLVESEETLYDTYNRAPQLRRMAGQTGNSVKVLQQALMMPQTRGSAKNLLVPKDTKTRERATGRQPPYNSGPTMYKSGVADNQPPANHPLSINILLAGIDNI